MSWVAVGVAGATVVGGAMQANSAKKAAAAQGDAAAQAAIESGRQFDISRNDMAPYRQVGQAGVRTLADLMGIGRSAQNAGLPEKYQGNLFRTMSAEEIKNNPEFGANTLYVMPEFYNSDPAFKAAAEEFIAKGHRGNDADADEVFRGILQQHAGRAPATVNQDGSPVDDYQMFGESPLTRRFTVNDFWNDPVTKLSHEFGLSEGRKGIDRMAGANGMRRSGQTLKALTKFGTDYTGQKAAESQQRFIGDQTNVYNRFAGITGTGQTAATTTGQLGAANSANVGNLITGAGNARGAASIAQGNAWGSAFNNIGNWWNQRNMVNQLNGGVTSNPQPVNWGMTGSFDQQAVG